ncbi:hypothetical protein [Marivirga tractuosa]|uniref:hypothetical protein n=1 Tax=Marivirga tractuosa TaxID=1006 RepID=UPI0011D2961E|nr:hypothetical protein [Marivirga tractuosa]
MKRKEEKNHYKKLFIIPQELKELVNRILKNIFFILILSLVSSQTIAQNYEACKNTLIDAISNLNLIEKPSGNRVYELSMTVINISKNNQYDIPQELASTTYINRDSRVFKSEKISLFQNEKESFAVVHPSEAIFWTDMVEDTNRYERIDELSNLKIEYFKKTEVIGCVEFNKDNINFKSITVIPVKDSANVISTYTFLISSDKKSLKKLTVKFKDEHILDQQEFIINNLDFNSDFRMPEIRDLIFDRNTNNLLNKYNSYKLIDNREK